MKNRTLNEAKDLWHEGLDKYMSAKSEVEKEKQGAANRKLEGAISQHREQKTQLYNR